MPHPAIDPVRATPAEPSAWAREHLRGARARLDGHGIDFPQHDGEFAWLLDQIRPLECRTLIEIGSRAGGSLYTLGTTLAPGSRVLAVDLPGARWGFAESRGSLLKVAELLRADGLEVEVIFGDSHDPEVASRVESWLGDARADFIFIDGDHTYEGVRADWLRYGPLAQPRGIVAFHDIHVPDDFPDKTFGVPRLWSELKRSAALVTRERIELWGIGIVEAGAGESAGQPSRSVGS